MSILTEVKIFFKTEITEETDFITSDLDLLFSSFLIESDGKCYIVSEDESGKFSYLRYKENRKIEIYTANRDVEKEFYSIRIKNGFFDGIRRGPNEVWDNEIPISTLDQDKVGILFWKSDELGISDGGHIVTGIHEGTLKNNFLECDEVFSGWICLEDFNIALRFIRNVLIYKAKIENERIIVPKTLNQIGKKSLNNNTGANCHIKYYDYASMGGDMIREEKDGDCSSCLFFHTIDEKKCWGICLNKFSERSGMLTHFNQAGKICHIKKEENS